MKKIIYTFLLLAFFSIAGAEEISACSCLLSPKTESLNSVVKKAYKNSTAIFVGEVVAVNQKPDAYFVEVTLKIKQKWNDEIGDTVIINTGKGGDCGYSFETGKEYLIYANGDKNNLSTNICTRTALAGNNADITILNKIKKRKIKSSPK